MNIILIGFMGTGKSTVAVELAKKLKQKMVEADALVLSISGRKSINEIFAVDGEIHFRSLEIKIAKKLSTKNNTVISTGGGIILNKICIDFLKKNGKVFFLATSFKEIKKRLEGDNSRPLFSNINTAYKLFQFRKNIYKNYADFTISTDGKSVNDITNIIIKKI